MKKTRDFNQHKETAVTVDTTGLQALLGCGRETAVKIGTQAAAKVQIGRRVLWNREKVQRYIAEISGE